MKLMETVSAESDEMYKPDPLERLLRRALVAGIMLGGEGDVNIAAQQAENAGALGGRGDGDQDLVEADRAMKLAVRLRQSILISSIIYYIQCNNPITYITPTVYVPYILYMYFIA